MSRTKRIGLCVEMLVCFGPVAVTVALGCIVFPLWILMLLGIVASFFGGPMFHDAGLALWSTVASILFVVGGVVGLIAVYLALMTIIEERQLSRSDRRRIVRFSVVGAVALLGFNAYVSGFDFDSSHDVPTSLAYLILPIAGAGHLLYLGRDSIFSKAI